jgi:hypothetical protein
MVKRKGDSLRSRVALVGLLAGLVPGTIIIPAPTAAHDAGVAFLGGLIGGHILTNMARRSEEQTQALQTMAYEQPPTVVQAAPAPQPAPAAASASSSAPSIEQKLNTLDQLAAQGYITKQEYQARRQALLNTL